MKDTENLRLTIKREDDLECPRDSWDHAATMATWHSRYDLGDEQPGGEPKDWFDDLPEGTIALPLFLIDHSGLSMSTGSFHDPWDSGQVGFIYMEPDAIRKEYNLGSGDLENLITDDVRDKVLALLKAEVAEYDTYLRGDVWHYLLETGTTCEECDHTTWEHDDSCGGIYASDEDKDTIEHLRSMIPDEAQHLIEAAWENRE